MNIFGSFTFSRLIETFIPGLVWLATALLVCTNMSQWFPVSSDLFSFVNTHDASALALVIAASIILGLISNIVVFMGFYDWLVRKWVRRHQPDLFFLYDYLAERVRLHFWNMSGCNDEKKWHIYQMYADPELLILRKIGVDELNYIREQYWYHLQFQINLLLAIAGLILALAVVPGTPDGLASGPGKFLELSILFALCCLLLAAARKNYGRHIAKMTSFMAAILGNDTAPPPAA